jgi:hypothetical protein
MKDENGMIYPLVITVCFLMLLFFGYLSEKVYSERQFVFRQEEQLKQVRLVQQALDKSIKIDTDSVVIPNEYQFYWQEGTVYVTIDQTTEDERTYLIKAVTERQNTKTVKVYYNVSQKSVTKWVEG